jgi:hypothetical protein
MQVGATVLLMCLMCVAMIDPAFAGYFHITPAPPPPAPPPPGVPEFDGTGAIAAIALLASIGAVLLGRSKHS